MQRLPESIEAALIAVNDGAQSIPALAQRLDISETEARARLNVLINYGLIEQQR